MPVRVMTYNILKGGIGRQNNLKDVIQLANADVVVLQEVTDLDVLRSLAHSLEMQSFFGTGNRKTKVALLSKLHVSTFESHHPRFPIWHNMIEAEVKVRPDRSIYLIGVHLIPHLWLGFELWRSFEIKYILNRCKRFAGEPVLIAGDFNAIAPGDEVMVKSAPASIKAMLSLQGNRVFRFAIQALLSAGFRDSFRSLHPEENGFTYPTRKPSTRFDYIFVNPGIQEDLKVCRAIRELDSVLKASDHYPVLAEFDL